MHILLYFNLDFNKDKGPKENLNFILDNIEQYNCMLRNYWDDGIHTQQIELCGKEEDLRKFYNFVYKTEVTDDEWKNILSLGINV